MDIRSFEVSNWLWAVAYSLAVPLLVYSFLTAHIQLLEVFGIVLSLFLGFLIMLGGFMGGADGKAIIAMGLLAPSLAPIVIILGLITYPIAVLLLIFSVNYSRMRSNPDYTANISRERFWRRLLIMTVSVKVGDKPTRMEKYGSLFYRDGGMRPSIHVKDELEEVKRGDWVQIGAPTIPFFLFALIIHMFLWG